MTTRNTTVLVTGGTGLVGPRLLKRMFGLVGAAVEPSAEPLTNPWFGQMDASLARSLGFRPTVPTVYQAGREGLL